MNRLLPILLFFFGGMLFPGASFTQYDATYVLGASAADEKDLDHLSDYLLAGAQSDKERIWRFYVWLSHRIRYDQGNKFVLDHKPNQYDVAQTLRSRKAVCLGYACLLSALCKKANIPCEVVSGYSKTLPSLTPNLEAPDHAWNAVLLDGKWQLVDATWAANIVAKPSDFSDRDADYYFLAPPSRFLLDHLPADPMWQLVDCPMTTEQFKENPSDTSNLQNPLQPCWIYTDSLKAYQLLSPDQQQLKSLFRAYHFHPTTSNAEQLGHAYMDQFIRLSEIEERLQQSDSTEHLLEVQIQLFQLANKAQQYTPLFDWQKENLAYTYLNHAVGLSRKLNDTPEPTAQRQLLLQMQEGLLQSQQMLQEVKPNSFTENGLDRCREYLDFVAAYLQNLR